MDKYKYLIKNVGVLTLSNFATKLLSFFLVPLYTSVLTTSDYGTYDLFNTTVGVLLPILTLNIQEGVMRYAMEKSYNRKAVVTIGFRYFLIGSTIVLFLLGANSIINFNSMIRIYGIFFFLMFFTQALSGIVSFYIRGIDKIADLSISSVIASAVTIVLNILFLVIFKWGLVGYFIANIIGPLIQDVFLVIRGKMLRDTDFTKSYASESKQMLNYSKPLIANSIAWWVNNASDRYIVILFCGLASNGIYSVSSKIPSILNVFQTIFNQAWALSAVKDYDPKDSSGFFSNTYKVYNCVMTILCSCIIVSDKILARFLYAKDFYSAWQYVPWLTIAILFGALSGYIGGFFTAVKDSKLFAISTLIGAVTNIILNLIFTPIIGPLGAAIATTVCYLVVYIVRLIQSQKYITLHVNFIRDFISYFFLILQAIVLLVVDKAEAMYGILICLFVLICLLYTRDFRAVFAKLLKNR